MQNQPHDGKNAFGGVCSERQGQRQNTIHTVLCKMSFQGPLIIYLFVDKTEERQENLTLWKLSHSVIEVLIRSNEY